MAIEKLLEEALALTPKERSRLAAALLRSLEPDDGDELSEEEWLAAWGKEAERRMKEIEEGRAQTISYDELKAQMRELLGDR